ncbi:MAG: WecB/TagA/CpsF family glycosyltransferase [Candidatus Levybacteria bacterium]|nr:WecB/TagA/CpsF family glycosyltransferase [Candidatus Levybacteria bacterium]
MIDKKNILGVGISDATKEEILEYVIKSIEFFKKKLFFVTPNPEFLVLAHKNPKFKSILNKADLASVDGIGLIIASKILGKDFKGRFTGVDLVEGLCKMVSEKPITVGFLGGRGEVAKKAAECLRKKYSGLRVVFAQEEWPTGTFALQSRVSDDVRLQDSEKQSLTSASLSKSRRQSDRKPTFNSSENELPRSNYTLDAKRYPLIDILFVAFGAPKQEFWINENLDKIPVKIAIGVGGAFDYISGEIPRAPDIIRNIGFEWLFRLIIQPWRIRRQLSLLEFIWLVIKEKLSKN